MPRILIVDDIKQHQETLATPFRSTHDVKCVGNLEEADRLLSKWWPDIALVDAIFPKTASDLATFQAGSFLELIEDKAASSARRPAIIILSGRNESLKKFDEVRSWLNDGRIQDVIAKATADMGVEFFQAVVQLRVENLLESRKWRIVQTSAESDSDWFQRLGIITRSPKMLALRRHLEAAARSDLCILLIGEIGTGKTLLAQAIRRLTRPDKPFVEINSANISPGIFNEVMFGIEGDKKNPGHSVFIPKIGHMERAEDGTFFLDDIHNLPDEHQAKLNQVLQSRKFVKVGGSEIPFRARFISATDEDLAAKMQQGKFRAELYGRINGLQISIPKLSERAEDIPELAESFLESAVRKHRYPTMHLNTKCLDVLRAYNWQPHNVRQLEHLIEKVAAYAPREGTDDVEIEPDLLLELEPDLAKAAEPEGVFDGLLKDAGIGAGRWADLSQTEARESIRALLSDSAKEEFERMYCALQPRDSNAGPGSSGRRFQDPATLHCLKGLLYVLLSPQQSVDIDELGMLLQLKWAQAKKVQEVLGGKLEARLEASPSFAPFVKLPEAGKRRTAKLLDGILL